MDKDKDKDEQEAKGMIFDHIFPLFLYKEVCDGKCM